MTSIKNKFEEVMSFDGFITTYCRKCHRRERGRTFIDYRKPFKSTDGGNAFAVFWLCEEKAHIQKPGFTKPVDFNDIYGEVDNNESSMPSVDASEEEWEDWARDQQVKHGLAT